MAMAANTLVQAYGVSGGRIYDDANNLISTRGVNWFAAESASRTVLAIAPLALIFVDGIS